MMMHDLFGFDLQKDRFESLIFFLRFCRSQLTKFQEYNTANLSCLEFIRKSGVGQRGFALGPNLAGQVTSGEGESK